MTSRQERTKCFEEFSDNSTKIFEKLWDKSNSNNLLKNQKEPLICPKGSNGGLDKKIIEVFFGMEYHSWGKVLDKSLNIRHEAKVIYGARLEYRLTDNGYVLCILTPSTTDHFKYPEEGILLDIIKEPSQLKNKSQKHWDYLVSYMLVTNVDCEPRIQDRLRVWFLRNFKRCFKSGVSQERKAIVDFGYIARWFFSVGLSGGVIFLTTIWLNSKTENDVVSQLKIVTTKLTAINDQQLNLNYELEMANKLLNSLSSTSEKIMLNGVDKTQFDKTLNDISNAINQSEIDRGLLQQKKLKITDKQ